MIDIVEEFQDHGIRVVAEDCLGDADEIKHEFPNITLANLVGGEAGVDRLVAAVSHNQYAQLTPSQMRTMLRPKQSIFGDVKGLYCPEAMEQQGMLAWRL